MILDLIISIVTFIVLGTIFFNVKRFFTSSKDERYKEDFTFHINRIDKLFNNSVKNFSNQNNSKAQGNLTEAMINVEKAIKFSVEGQKSIDEIKSTCEKYLQKDGKELFDDESVIYIWNESIKTWGRDFNSLFDE